MSEILAIDGISGSLTAESAISGNLTVLDGITGGLSDIASLTGGLSEVSSLSGTLSATETISGEITIPSVVGGTYYDGDYEVTPKASGSTVLATNGLLMRDDVTVVEIPYYETSNVSGTTIYIANEV